MLKDSVTASAHGGVYIKENAGNLRLNKIDSGGFDVYVEVVNGGIMDANQSAERDERTYQQLKDGVWSDLQLTESSGAGTKIDNIVASYKATKEGEYRSYWVYRNSVGGSYDTSQKITLSDAERASYEDFYATQWMTADTDKTQEVYVQDAIKTLENSRTQQYHTLHDQFSDYFTAKGEAFPTAYDTGFTYALNLVDPDEESDLRGSVKVWTEEELIYAIGAGILMPITDTQASIEDPNILGDNVTLIASRGVGSATGRVTIDVSGSSLHLTDDERVALASAERDDVAYWGTVSSATVDFKNLGSADQIVRKDGVWTGFVAGDRIRISGSASNDDIYLITSVSGSTITLSADDALVNESGKVIDFQHEILDPLDKSVTKSTITVDQREDVDVESSGEINVTAGANVYLGSEGDINIDYVQAGETVRIKGGQGIYNVDIDGAPNVVSGDLVLEAAVASIGTADNPFVVNLTGTATVTARANTGIFIKSLDTGTDSDSTIYVGTMYSAQGGIYLHSQDSIVDGLDTVWENIRASVVELNAITGGIGETGDYLDVNVLGAGTLTATAFGTIRIAETEGNMYVNRVSSSNGDVDLKAHLSILDANNDINADIIGLGVILTADVVGIGTTENNLDINTNGGTLKATSDKGNAYIIETDGDLRLDQVSSGDGVAFITVPSGRILNGRSSGSNVISGKTYLFASGDIGQPEGTGNGPVTTQVGNIEGQSTAGSTWIMNNGALTVGGVTSGEGPGILSGGSVNIGASSPVIITRDIVSGRDEEGNFVGFADITVTSTGDGDDSGAWDAADGPDDIYIPEGITLDATGNVILQAGDALNIYGTVIAANSLIMRVDYGNADPGTGGSLDITGTLTASNSLIEGESDDDYFPLYDSFYGITGDVTVRGYGGSDLYILNLYGQGAARFNIYDETPSGDLGVDRLMIYGTDDADFFLFRPFAISSLEVDESRKPVSGGVVERVNYD
ncbi:MAG: hypothetical protein PHH09_13195, partial [Methanoregulaceae archaeon]|nr:hypothetical protein [Methanoregulaceae archaeon]